MWPVDEGAFLQPQEITMLAENGFSLKIGIGSIKSAAAAANATSSTSKALSFFWPKFRDGKLVKWITNLTSEF